jgi:two-component system CheB/CheR fusion protein
MAKKSKSKKEQPNGRAKFPIVGIGASAGGLEALQQLFRAIPVGTGMGFVVVTHQHPDHTSMLPELLGRETGMPVVQIADGMNVEPNHVYVLGPGVTVHIEAGILHLSALESTEDRRLPINIFFRSLADDMHERAIGVVMSGTGSDGTLGIQEIKAQGGMTMAQQIPSARYGGMPESAQKSGLVDFVATPADMPRRIMDYTTTPYVAPRKAQEGGFSPGDIDAILRFLRSRRGQDFSAYKRSTIERRIQRRMSVHGINKAPDYLTFLHENNQEAQLLFSELLISVTSFFRDPEAFAALEDQYLALLMKNWPEDDEYRIWVAGCATGEEAYSIAIVFDEVRRRFNKTIDVRIFASDLDAQAIEQARRGSYPAGISADVSPERLQRYFVGDDSHGYAIRKEIRDMVIFAQHNMLSDPPFMRLQLVVCRNVLIYLQSKLQERLIPLFHHVLAPDGLLFLGSSESVGAENWLFDTLDARWKIFRRTNVAAEVPELPIKMKTARPPEQELPDKYPAGLGCATDRLVERMLLDQYAPVSILFDHEGTISYIHGRTGAYLELGQRQPRMNVFDMAREGLQIPLRTAAHQALQRKERIVKQGIRVRTNGDFETVDLAVNRIMDPEALRGMLFATITPAARLAQPQPEELERIKDVRTENRSDLDCELQNCREANQSLREEMQANQEEMQSANEELQSINEELQSSKEEMESLNEELSTVNNELNVRNQELVRARDDLQNLLNSTDLAVIFLDRQLHVKRYTVRARSFVGLRDADINRPISELQLMVERNGLLEGCRHVLDTLEKRENEVTTPDGKQYLMRILPYRSAESVIDGVVVTFIDITERAEAHRYAESIVDTVRESLVVLNGDLMVASANKTFYRQFKVTPEETEGRFVYDLGKHQLDIPQLRALLEEVIPQKSTIEDYEVQHTFKNIGEKIMVLNARRLAFGREAEKPHILLAIEDQTEKKMALRQLNKSETRYRRLVEELHSFIIGIDIGGRITFFNTFSEKVFGYSRDEVIGMPFVDAIVPAVDSYGTNNSGIIEQILADPQKFSEIQSEGLCKDGRRIFFAWSAIPVPGEGEQDIEILIDGNDITRAKQAQEELKKRSEELAAANRELEAFSYSVSHDLRNPLRTVNGFVEILLEDYAERLDEQGQGFVRRIDASTKKIQRIIDDLLALSRIGRQEITRENLLPKRKPRASSSARSNRKAGPCTSFATTAWVLTSSLPARYSSRSSARTPKKSTTGPASGCRLSSGLSAAMAAAYGPRGRSARVRHSISHCKGDERSWR